MRASDLVNLSGLVDDAKCFALVRQHRWPEDVQCPGCNSSPPDPQSCDGPSYNLFDTLILND